MTSSFEDTEYKKEGTLQSSYYYNLGDNVEVDKYVMMVEPELKKLGLSLNDSAFIAKIIKILDSLVGTQNFDKTLFFHILDFANLDREAPVKLLDFFRSFFSVYETMKTNRDRLANENNSLTERIQALEIKRTTQQKEEKVKSDGITSNSQVKVHFVNSQALDPTLVLSALKVKFQIGSEQEELYLNAIDTKISFQIHSMEMAELPFQVWLLTGKEEILLDSLNVKEMLDNKIERSYTKKNIKIDASFFWQNSLVTFYNKEIGKLESQINENKESVTVLNKGVAQIEGTFKTIFQGAGKNQPGEKAGTMGKEIEITNQIEQMVLKATGKEIIIWDYIVYLLNKLLIPLLVLEFLRRYDILTLFLVICIIGVEIQLLNKSQLYKFLILLLCSIGVDIVWILYDLSNWDIYLPYEGDMGSSIRTLCFVCCILLLILKLIMAFSLWKMALQHKLLSINQINPVQAKLALGPSKASLFGNVFQPPVSKQQTRPRLLKNTTQAPQMPVRNFDDFVQK